MPRSRGKLKIQWIVENASRNATFRKRRATLLEKAKELSTLCKIPVAVVVYGPGNAEPASWPELEEAKKIMQKYLALPEASKATRRLDNEGLLRQGLRKVGKRFESCKASTRQLEVNLILNDISLGRRSSLDDLPPEIAAALRSEVDLLRSSIYERLNSLTSAAAAAVLVSSQQEPLIVAPLAMAPPPMVANAPLLVHPPPLEPDLLLVPPEEPLMAPPPEPPMVSPFAMAPPMLADVPVLVPHVLLAAAGEPLAAAAAAGVGVNEDDGFPRNGSYLLEVADAILDDGRSGHAVQATYDDVDRLLREHGLESFIKPKP